MGEPSAESSLPAGLATPARLACYDRVAFVRDRRAEILDAVGDGGARLSDVFEAELTGVGAPEEPTLVDDDVIVATMKILPLVEAVPHLGKVTSRRLLASLFIDAATPVERLDPDQRSALLAAIDEYRRDLQPAARSKGGAS